MVEITAGHASGNFAGASLYRSLLGKAARGGVVREAGVSFDPSPFSERHLQCVWYDAAWRPAGLRTTDGEEVVVRDPGRWNLEAGPDFIDALLEMGPGRRVVRGDVEVHIDPRDWVEHGHESNPAYRRVVAHVCYSGVALPQGTLPAGAVQILLRRPLAAVPTFSFENIDIAAYPYAAIPAGARPCGEILAGWGAGDRGALLDAAGQERLVRKTDAMRYAIEARGAAQVLYEEIMCALGYKANRAPFRTLARLVQLDALVEAAGGDVIRGYSLLLGVSGLMPSKVGAGWDNETKSFVRAMWDEWWRLQAGWERRAMPRAAWKTGGMRPQNSPLRRLAAAAALFSPGGPFGDHIAAAGRDEVGAWLGKTAGMLGGASVEYWTRRLSLGGTRHAADLALVGEGRVSTTLVNVVVPFLAATGRDVSGLIEDLAPEDENAIARQTANSLFGRDHNKTLYGTGLRQQGLIQIFQDFCLGNRSGCSECGLVKALAKAG